MRSRLAIMLGILVLAGCGDQSRAQSASSRSAAASAAAPGAATATAAATDPLAARSLGSASAPITVYEMSDFQCPYCRLHAIETFPAIQREYIATGKVRWIFLNFPLTSKHPNAAAAAALAVCAGGSGKFWPMHDLLFKHQDAWAPLKDPGAFLITLADSLGIARPGMLQCLQSPGTRQIIESEAQGAVRAGANSTPSFYIEGGLMGGAYPIDVFRHILDSIYVVKTARKGA